MMQMPSIKMHTLLIRYTVEIFEPTTGRFIVEEVVGEVSLGAVDVECIFNLDNLGLSASDILSEEGEDIKDRVPPQLLSKSTGNIVIDDLIADIIKNKSADDDFLRKVVLVLLGTVLAPMSSKIVPKQYYALVDDVKRISKINWNAFTLDVLLDRLRVVRKASRRDRFDYDNGRGRGNAKVEDNITQEYRVQEAKVPQDAPQKAKPKPASVTARKSKAAISADEMMKAILKRCMEYIHKEMRQIPDLVVERLLEKLNKEGVMYKPVGVEASDPIIDLTQPEEDVAYQKAVDEEKTPAKKNVDNGAAPTKPNDEIGATPDNPWIVGNSSEAGSSDIDISATSVTNFMAKAKPTKAETNGKEEDFTPGKQKQTLRKKFECPYALDKPSRRATRALFNENKVPEVVADELTPELIDAAVSFVELTCKSKKNMKKRVYYNASGNALRSERLQPVIDAYLEHLALRVRHDRHLCPAWRSKYLVDRALARDNLVPSRYNMDSAIAKAGAVARVLEEYTGRDKTYVPLNIGNTHWMTVVMHMPKKEFQVMDSLYPLDMSIETVEALRLAIGQEDMLEANHITAGKYPDVTKWPIKEYDMPQQEDG
ncbi:uncharacterized protein [Aegilops tauschii subsp. strangulata]|uniref:uncharacterized protein n=1 Tax=Aegilops tauschii subsp. strangulata TaxID=200361 RepID=UPI00098B88A2|nr:uncharacterized protein LOC109742126 [Aegilops tauschii subsp. strangulata]